MRKIKEILFSENGMKVVNTLLFWDAPPFELPRL